MDSAPSAAAEPDFDGAHSSWEPPTHSDEHVITTEEQTVAALDQDPEKKYYSSSRRGRRARRVLLSAVWLILAHLVVVSLLLSHCRSARRSKAGEGLLARRLAGENREGGSFQPRNPFFVEGEWTSLDAEELARLCAELGHQPYLGTSTSDEAAELSSSVASNSASAGYTAFQGDYEQPFTSSSAPLLYRDPILARRVDASSRKRAYPTSQAPGEQPEPSKIRVYRDESGGPGLPGDVFEVESAAVQPVAGPSSVDRSRECFAAVSYSKSVRLQEGVTYQSTGQQGMLPAKQTLVAPPNYPVSSSFVPARCTFPASQSKGSADHDTSDQNQSSALFQSPTASLVPLLPSDGEASTSAKTTQLLSMGPNKDDSRKVHPYVRLPVLAPGVKPRQSLDLSDLSMVRNLPIVTHLKVVRDLFALPVLNLTNANMLVTAVEELAIRAIALMTASVSLLRPSNAVRALGRRFLVFNAVHSAMRVLGNNTQLEHLWREMLRVVPTEYSHEGPRAFSHKSEFQFTLAKELSAAMELYKAGKAPTEEQELKIKRALFCSTYSPTCFLETLWDQWRLDDEEFQKTCE
ncbi:hypothetical protein, conserved [Eimeria necatrix]|uniref:Transmembrane protein n=1 Tax=Eimeria necatrix TaxID=51315 RepID=U6N077_9EIME|nr:hypothetical protein, conserved [Eimeria necatrix]CDJ67355.1 hypothetical protein, conserved [Eimeria necatrix]